MNVDFYKPPGSVSREKKVNSAPDSGIILYVFKEEKSTLYLKCGIRLSIFR